MDSSCLYPSAKVGASIHIAGIKNSARITIFSENDFEVQPLRYRTSIKP